MLVLRRKEKEAIVLGPHDDALVRVTVIRIRRSTVVLRIVARSDMQVLPAEIADALENRVKN